MKYTEHRNLSADNVRSLCISKEWYTRGDCQAYSNQSSQRNRLHVRGDHVGT